MPPDNFLKATPFQVRLVVQAFQKSQDQQFRANKWLAWHVGSMAAWKIAPNFEDFVGRDRTSNKHTDPLLLKANLVAQVRAHNQQISKEKKSGNQSR